MTTIQAVVFAGMVFTVVMLLSAALIIPTVGSGARASRKMRKRISNTLDAQNQPGQSLIRDGYSSEKSSKETNSEDNAMQKRLRARIKQAGLVVDTNKVVMWTCLLAAAGAILPLIIFSSWLVSLVAAPVLGMFPYFRISTLAKRRVDKFEEQLPEALDVMSRALKAGHPFNETMNFVAHEMDDPIAHEFGRVFSDINFGMPSKVAFHALMHRVPSVGLHTLITAVLIQQESGGALAEILEKVADVIRGRFRLQRKLKSLSAEGRMSAWVLTLIPFALAGMLMIIAPDYLPVLLTDATGQKILAFGAGMLCAGVVWIKLIINIKV